MAADIGERPAAGHGPSRHTGRKAGALDLQWIAMGENGRLPRDQTDDSEKILPIGIYFLLRRRQQYLL